MGLVLIGGLECRGDYVNVTVHLLQDALAGAQTEANSVGVQLLTVLKLSKGFEKVLDVILSYANAFILHSYEYLLVLLLKPALNADVSFAGELVGVGQEVK